MSSLAAEQRLEDFARASMGSFWETDADLRLTWVSATPDEESVAGLAGIIARMQAVLADGDGADDDGWRPLVADMRARRPFRDRRLVVLADDGEELCASLSGIPAFDGGGFRGYRGMVRNVTAQIRTEEATVRAWSMLSDAIESIDEGFALFDGDDRLVLCNDKYRRQLALIEGLLRPGIGFGDIHQALVDRAQIRATHTDERVHRPDARPGRGTAWSLETTDGRWFRCRAYATRDGGRVLIQRDVSEDKRREDQLRTLSQAVEQSPVSVVVTDVAGRIEYVNPRFTQVTGYRPDEILGQNPRRLKSGRMSSTLYRRLWRTILAGREWRGELQNRKKSGELYWESASISPIRDADGTITHFIAVKEDITVRKEYEARLLRQAWYDELTGLPNRSLAADRLASALSRAERSGKVVAVLFLDLDHFKTVNDTLGHDAGDRLLIEAARRLTGNLRRSDTVARLSSDEFAVILPDLPSADHAEGAVRRIHELFREPFVIEGVELFVSASIGVALCPGDGRDATLLMKNADAAMHLCKARGRNDFRFFTPDLDDAAHERLTIAAHLRRALDRDELSLRYQPIVDVKTGRTVAVEALLRWQSPELGAVGPDRFVPLAEDTGLIVPIGTWVLATAAAEAARWSRRTAEPPRLAVNVSTRQFRDARFLESVLGALERSGLPPERLELEITETLLIEDAPSTLALLQNLEGRGIRVSIDDFGTGYSSLGYLKRYPVHTLKIDRGFVRDVTTDPGDSALVRAIVAMAHGLGLGVVGEGVETEDQLRFLSALGCEMAQGYLFCRPITAEALADHLRAAPAAAE